MQISVCETQVKILIIQSNLYIFDVARLLFLYYYFFTCVHCVPKVVNIEPCLLEFFENVADVRFLRYTVYN